MKKALIILAAAVLMPQVSFGQATITFKTAFGSNPADQFVTGTVGGVANQNLDRNFFGQLWVGASGGNLSMVGSPVRFTFFGTGEVPAAAGAIDAGTVQVTTSGDSFNADVQLYAWDAAHATFAAAQAAGAQHGISATMTGALGGTVTGAPNNPQPDLPSLGFQGFSLVPEPGTITLGLLGLGGLVAARRRRQA